MKGEFSRLTFDPRRHFSGTLWQQGRVGLDADWNEWVEQVLYRFRTETIDVIGECGRPKDHPGFTVIVNSPGTSTPPVQLSAGRLYAGGMLAELEGTTDFMAQYDWPIPSPADWNEVSGGAPYPGLDWTAVAEHGTQRDLFYVEVWLRHVTALIDEAERTEAIKDAQPNPVDWNSIPETGDYVRERALGGPDTCTRLQTVAQVKRWPVNARATTCDAACAALANAVHLATVGAMQVDVQPTPAVTSPCDEPQLGGYGGAENRTYRVEVHDPGPAGMATFKWSLENGAFLVGILDMDAYTVISAGTNIVVQTIGNDQLTSLKLDDWVELCGEETELGMWRNPLAQLAADPTALPGGTWQIQLKGPASVIVPRAPFLRRWSDNTQTITVNTPFALDAGSGLSVTFYSDTNGGVNPAGTYFHEMDYWIWAARTRTRDIEPPAIMNTPQTPRGIERHTCCLALVTWSVGANGNISVSSVSQCPEDFPPLTQTTSGDGCCCCKITAGDGKTSQGQFSNLAAAFANLQPGGAICILPGDYTVDSPIEILQDNVIVEGCGLQTKIRGDNGIFILNRRSGVVIRNLAMDVQTAPAIVTNATNDVRILENLVTVSQNPLVFGISVQGAGYEIARNSIQGEKGGGGGIEVRGNSRAIRVLENTISRGQLRGITLGSLAQAAVGAKPRTRTQAPTDKADRVAEQVKLAAVFVLLPSEGLISGVEISRNTIFAMGLEGIGVPRLTLLKPADILNVTKLLSLRDIIIADNTIERCGNGPVSTPSERGAITLEDVEFARIFRNRILGNGHALFTSGIYILLGAGVRVYDNYISRNGTVALINEVQDGAGINIAWAVPPPAPATADWPSYDGWPAVSINDNTVLAEASPALKLTGAGPMIVSRNRFTTESLPATPNSGGGVALIGDFGIGDDYSHFLGLQNLAAGVRVNPVTDAISPSLQMLLRVGGEVLFSENQCLFDYGKGLLTAHALIPVMTVTLDDLGFSSNQLRVRTPPTTRFHLLYGSLLFGLTLRVEGNRFKESLRALHISCIGLGVLVIGMGNIATHCLLFAGAGSAVNSNLINPTFQDACSAAGMGG